MIELIPNFLHALIVFLSKVWLGAKKVLTLIFLSLKISNPRVRADINLRLSRELVEVKSPYSGIQTVRKVLSRHALDIPTLYDLNPQEDELSIELNQFGNELSVEEYSMYILYYLADDGTYDFYAEAIDNESLDEILADEEDEEELELE